MVGVPDNGQALSAGDRFVAKHEVCRDDVMSGALNPTRLNGQAVDLVVTKSHVMRKEVPKVPQGITAALSLTGSGLEHVMTGCFLRTKEQ